MALHWVIGYPRLYMVGFYDLSGLIWDKSAEVRKQIQQLREKKSHYTDYAEEYREFCVNFLELMSKSNVSLSNCQVFKETAFPIDGRAFEKVLAYSEIYLKIIKEK